MSTLSIEQNIVINMIPYRLFKLSEACEDADKNLKEYLIDDEPVKGTHGELEAAQAWEFTRKQNKNTDQFKFNFGKKDNQPLQNP